MSIDINLPELGDGLDSGDVLNVLVAEGDVVQVEQGILELETEKAVAEIPATHAGRVTAIHVKVGETVPIGAALITIEPAEAPATATPPVDTTPPKTAPSEAAPPEAAPAQTALPEAAPVAATQLEIESPSELQTAASPAKPLPVPAAEAPLAAAASAPAADSSSGAPAGPAVRRFARELGVDLTNVNGTGADGRITKQDVRSAVRRATQTAVISAVQAADSTAVSSEIPAPEAVTPPGEVSSDDWGPVIVDRVTKIRSTIAANMVQSKATAPHVTNFDDADVTELEQIRQSSKKDYAEAGIRLTTMPFIIKAVAQALRKHPVINASLDLDAGQILYKQYVNVGVAVDTERGLMVPVVRQPDRLSIAQIARALSEMAEKARTSKITIDDMRGGTFTISNLGAIGGTFSTPVINTPEVAILLTGRSREMPVVVDGDVEIRLMMPLSLSYDHRLVDGAAAARFLNEIKGYLEAPGRLLLAP